MTKVKNKFVEGLLKDRDFDIDKVEYGDLGYFYGKDQKSHPHCYSAFDSDGRVEANLPFWFLPCYTPTKHNLSLGDREFYAYHAITHPKSVWAPFIAAMPEQFEGYDTPEDKAWLVARVGLIFGQTAWKTLSKVEIGCFAVFHRRAYEFPGVRESLKLFLESEETKDLPLRWNVFAAHHIHTTRKTDMPSVSWSNGHNNFNSGRMSNTAVCWVTTKYQPDPTKSLAAGPGQAPSFMAGNSDKLFVDKAVKGPKVFIADQKERFTNTFETNPDFHTPVSTNLWYWNNKVAPYV